MYIKNIVQCLVHRQILSMPTTPEKYAQYLGAINSAPSECVGRWSSGCGLGVGIRRCSIEYNARNFVWSPPNVYSPPK